MSLKKNKEEKTILEYFNEVKDILKEVGMEDHFFPKSSLYLPDKEFKPPIIAYGIKKRNPAKGLTGMKPTIKRTNSNHTEEISGQIFESEVFYHILGKNYKKINEVRDWFEKIMIRQVKKLKKADVLESVFLKQLEDDVEEIQDNYFIKQPLVFYVKTPRAFKRTFDEIKEIKTIISIKQEE